MKYQNWRLSIPIVALCSTLVFSTSASLAIADDISSLKNGKALVTACSDKGTEKQLECYLEMLLIPETSAIVKIPTYKGLENWQGNLNQVKDFLQQRVDTFNQTQKTLKFRPFEWHSETSEHWLFGFRLGDGSRKISLITHIDTVPPGGSDRPFEPRIEKRLYKGEEMDFLVGRGTIDDKGPAIATLVVLRALAKQYDDNPKAIEGFTFELIFDTSEETSMATRRYLKVIEETAKPDFGIVFDAVWTIRGEKGIERPVFWLPLQAGNAQGELWIDNLNTSKAPVNQIPNTATAVIKGISSEVAAQFANQVKSLYDNHGFDDPYYRRAELEIAYTKGSRTVSLTTKVKGAQHGSVPHENRREGANPLVSLANFLAHLIDSNQLTNNEIGRMTQFINWGWGTQVLGEKHPDLLKASDDIFKLGTTYAITQFTTDTEKGETRLGIDIRYAQGHYPHGWDGKTSGSLPGKVSRFPYIFDQLVKRFDKAYQGTRIIFETMTKYPPDIRNPNSAVFQHINKAYHVVIGKDCPLVVIGGGTDAKGNVNLFAAGPLFYPESGPPVNLHGDNEAMPIAHIKLSAEILHRILLNEIQDLK
ncbi:M20/M25/M40 family metallo-hydrolase [Candidatus Parabeggiatoa sp. HSG14]|uniref:M20/M25/M40 family metallo-hydrolase n=1 Tax=Candidatus Parabeggiatoa sp. HSG14 TaxID=3055593 RepID=UPI0025A83DBD|nr:M20/M25/M40 family metallo-hydrolase [Thiotrichales bacterium HSG14]